MVVIVYGRMTNPAGLGTVAPPGVSLSANLSEWYDPDDQTFVGVAESPLGSNALDAAGLLARAQSIHARHPITNPETGEPYTAEGLEQAVTDWITEAGV